MTSTRRSRLHRPLLYCFPVFASFATSSHVISSGLRFARHLSVATSIFNALSVFHLRARKYRAKHESSTYARSAGVASKLGSFAADSFSFARNCSSFVVSVGVIVNSRPLFVRSIFVGA